MIKNLLISAMSMAILTACGGGGGSSDPASAPTPSPVTNAAPQVSDAVVTDVNGGLVKPGDVLSFGYKYSDAENDVEGESRIQWLLNNEVISDAIVKEYTVQAAQEGHQISARIIPVAQTGKTEGIAASSNALTVAIDGAPAANNIQIKNSQDRFKPGAVLTASYDYFDPENNSEDTSVAGTQYRWLRNDEAINGATSLEYTLVTADEGQSLIFEITPVAVSGTLQGPAFLSAIIQVETNSAPSFSALTFNTETAVVGDTVTIKHIYQDADNDAQGSHVFSWYRDGVEIAGASGESYTINADDKGTNITAKATAVALTGTLNGTAQSVTGSLAIAATNQAPTVSNVVIVDKNGGLVVPGDELEVTWDYHDADGDEQGDTTIGWQYFRPNSSGGIPGSNGSKTYIVSGTYSGQKIQVVITPVAKTGETYGNATRSQKVSVMSLPTSKDHQIVDLNGGEIEVGDILEAQYTFVDADGDLEDVSGARFSWYRNNSDLVASGSSKTYTVVAADAGQTLKFNNSVRSDAGEQGYVYGSAPVQVADEVVLTDQVLQFNRDSAQKMVVGANFANVSVGEGAGLISYASSDDTIASVDISGKVTAKRPGEVSITSSIAADSTYGAADASYDLSIRANAYPIRGWASESALDFRFQEVAPRGLTVYGTSDEQCDLSDIHACNDSKLVELSDAASNGYRIIDQFGNLNANRYYTAEYGEYQGRIQISPQDSTIQEGAAVVFFNDKLWAFGGRYKNGGSNQIWTSVDGRSWQQETTNASQLFSVRKDAQVVAFKGKLWITGGHHYSYPDPQVRYADVWSSSDGIHWQQETDAAPFSPRADHQMVVANGALWLTGDDGAAGGDGKYWRSEDGINWQDKGLAPTRGSHHSALLSVLPGDQAGEDRLVLAERGAIYVADTNGEFPSKQNASLGFSDNNAVLLEVNGTLFFVDTRSGGSVYKSTDGIAWESVTLTHPIMQLVNTTPLVFKGRMWLFAGRGNDEPAGIYAHSSVDGASWKIETDDAEFAERYDMLATTFNNRIVAAGGNIGGHGKSDVWQTFDGLVWSQIKSHLSTERNLFRNAEMIEFNGKLWLTSEDTLYSSTDGTTWDEVSYVNYPAFNVEYAFPQFNLMIHDNKLWLIGVHKDNNDQLETRVSSSDDGLTWVSHTMTQPFGVNENFKAIAFNNKLWVMGGNSASTWSSSDGLVWEEHTALTTSLPQYVKFDVVEMDGKLWVAAGLKQGNQFTNEVWSSNDGIDWTLVTESAAFSPRGNHSLVTYQDELYIIGSRTVAKQNDNDVWKSPDGVQWSRAFQNIIEFDREPVVGPVND